MDIIREIRESKRRDKEFKKIVLHILERNKLAKPNEVAMLRDLINEKV